MNSDRAATSVEDDGLIFACLLNGTGGANLAQLKDVDTWRDADQPTIKAWLSAGPACDFA